MTEHEWKRKERSFKSRITGLKNKIFDPMTIEQKLILNKRIKDLREELRLHRLNKYLMVTI